MCLAEQSKSGTLFAIGDVSQGLAVGTYYGTQGCPTVVSGATVSKLSPTS